jgi:DNA phosphorothioation-dependent restriction protein DptH
VSWTDLHAVLLSRAFEKILGRAEPGAMAFVRCLSPDAVEALAQSRAFNPSPWHVWRVAGFETSETRTITADRAVEMREAKDQPILLLVDTATAGAGMDGIYSAAREIDEEILFKEALSLSYREITRSLSASHRHYAEQAVRKARGFGRRLSISLWTEFDFVCSVAARRRHPGELLYLLGLWPVQHVDGTDAVDDLTVSRLFVDRLLSRAASSVPLARRIEGLRLLDASEKQLMDLEIFLRHAATKSLLPALVDLEERQHLWVNSLRIEGEAQSIQGIELVDWRTNTGRVAKWSGLIDDPEGDGPPVLLLKSDAEKTGDYSRLEVKWKVRPENLEKGAAEYRVAVLTDMEEDLASREVVHTGKKEEKCRFSNDDFATLSEDALVSAKVVVSVIGNDSLGVRETEEFIIRFGQPPDREPGGVGKKVRTFSDGLVELRERTSITELVSGAALHVDSKGYIVMRTAEPGKTFRVFRPPLIGDLDSEWSGRGGAIGRWTMKVRASGAKASDPEFVPLSRPDGTAGAAAAWDRVLAASKRFAERLGASGGSVAQVYDDQSGVFSSTVKEYMLAWATLLETAVPVYALANTIEIQSLSGRTIGLVVLPSHPVRVAWLSAYDNLAIHSVFDQKGKAREVRDELAILDGAMFPAFLPGIDPGTSFVFADTLGFHAVGMVPDHDKEPKAAIAILARALGESDGADSAPTVGKQSASILGNEVLKYLDCHNTARLLHVHALRPGDGFTVARALGKVLDRFRRATPEEGLDDAQHVHEPGFVLELYPSDEQRTIAGRFITEVREKYRSGAGVLASDDHWMLESMGLPGGVTIPRLRWARKVGQQPDNSAHLAVAFDTFESRVILAPDHLQSRRPLYAFGMLSFFDRQYSGAPFPLWSSTVLVSNDGEKHPGDRAHSDRLSRIVQAVQTCVSRSLGSTVGVPTLQTEVSAEKARQLRDLHRLCDWVITLDRNAGLEYFDSPKDDPEVYDAYVIDCVPERQDLGCLQLITSTSNLEEVRSLLDVALDQMGLSRSRRNAEFLMWHLKALSGRLAIRLTGDKAPTSELIALALCHANSISAASGNDCWTPLSDGFFIPADDVRDLIPPLDTPGEEESPRSRPDLVYVTLQPRKGLSFQFIEVKYRRHLRTARSTDTLGSIRSQVESLRKRWYAWYSSDDVCASFRALRRAKLARVLHFYADKAHRHYLPDERYEQIRTEIERMIEKGPDYSFATPERPDRGWVFCPDYAGDKPMEIAPTDGDAKIYLFGPDLLPDLDFRQAPSPTPETEGSCEPADATVDTAESSGNEPVTRTAETDDAQLGGDHGPSTGENAAHLVPAQIPSISLGVDTITGEDVRWSLTIKGNPHLLIAGLPGMGKTTCLLNLCRQMVNDKIRPIVFSYHEDIDEKLQKLVNGVRFIDFDGLGFNPMKVMDRSARLAHLDIAGSLRDIFSAIFPELGDIQGEKLRRAIKESFAEKGWDDAGASMPHLEEPAFNRFLEILRSDPKPDRGLRTLLSRLDELDDYGFFRVNETQSTLWDNDEPTIIRIHTTQNENLQRAFAALVFYSLYKDMFRRGLQDRITHAVIFDEAHRAAGLKLIPTMAKECRKYGISLVLASQEAKDFNPSLFSAVANYLVLRLTEADAKALVRNVASSQQERLLVDRIKQMDRFRALYFREGATRPSLINLAP